MSTVGLELLTREMAMIVFELGDGRTHNRSKRVPIHVVIFTAGAAPTRRWNTLDTSSHISISPGAVLSAVAGIIGPLTSAVGAMVLRGKDGLGSRGADADVGGATEMTPLFAWRGNPQSSSEPSGGRCHQWARWVGGIADRLHPWTEIDVSVCRECSFMAGPADGNNIAAAHN